MLAFMSNGILALLEGVHGDAEPSLSIEYVIGVRWVLLRAEV